MLGMQVTWTGAQATALRVALGLTQKRFAEKSGIGLSTVKKWAALGHAITLSERTVSDVMGMLERATPQQRARFAEATMLLLSSGGTADTVGVQWVPGVWTAAGPPGGPPPAPGGLFFFKPPRSPGEGGGGGGGPVVGNI